MRVMFITGFAAVTLQGRQAAMPQARVLSKPFHLRDLVLEVDRLFEIGKRQRADALARRRSPRLEAAPRGRVAQW